MIQLKSKRLIPLDPTALLYQMKTTEGRDA